SSYFRSPRTSPPPLSFPTRRSSDLARSVISVSSRLSPDILPSLAQNPKSPSRTRKTATSASDPTDRLPSSSRWIACAGCHVLARSEEHTSELQSRENLVCRLLLEKK